MPRIKDTAITDTMVKCAALYDCGDSIPEIAEKLDRKADYVRWSLRIMGVSVDEMPYRPGTSTAAAFAKRWNSVVFGYQWEKACERVMKGLRRKRL